MKLMPALTARQRDHVAKVISLRQSNAAYTEQLQQVPADQWPAEGRQSNLIAVWRSNQFLVQVFAEADGIIRLSVNRTKLAANGRWQENITWDELQEIKNACGYPTQDAVEIYPAADQVVNVANIRHLWVLPQPIPYAWKKQKPESATAHP